MSRAGVERDRERRLALRAAEGDREAFAALVARHEAPLGRWLRRRLGDATRAEEATQEAFVRAWRELGGYDPRWAFSTWLYAIAQRTAATQVREAERERRRRARLAFAPPPPSPADGEARELGRRLWLLADATLPEQARAALWLRYAEDRSPRDIARILGMSAVAVRVMLHRARRDLARAHARTTDALTTSTSRSPAAGGASC